MQNLLHVAVPVLIYGGLIVVLALRRGLRGQAGALALCLLTGLAWHAGQGDAGLSQIWPHILWSRVATYALAAQGITFWVFTRAFLQKPVWEPARLAVGVVALSALVGVGQGWIPLSDRMLDRVPWDLPRLVTTAGIVVFGGSVLVALSESLVAYARRSSPLHRNRIVYGLLGAVLWATGVGLSFASSTWVWVSVGVHGFGALLLTYAVLQPRLPHIVTAMRRAVSYLLATILPAAVTAGLGAGALLLMGRSPLFRLRLTEDAFWGLVIAGGVTASLYRPLNTLVGRGIDRLFFGRRYETQRVVGEYGRAIEGLIALEDLTEVALTTIDAALGVPRSALLVVEEKRESGWWLRVLPGVEGTAEPATVILPAHTPMADWLVEQGAPLHQYTLDVDPQFEALEPSDRQAWRQLDMELFLPIKHRGVLVGVLALGLRRSGQPYAKGEVALLETLANQTGAALENARLFDQARRRADQLALLNEVGRMITASLDLEAVVDAIVERLAGAFPRGAGFLFLLDQDEEHLALRGSFGREMAEELILPLERGFVGGVAAGGQSALVTDLAQGVPGILAVEERLLDGAHAAICAPIVRREGPLGAILIVVPRRAGVGAVELNWLDTVSAFAAVALENARQVAAREARLRRQVETLRIQVDELKRARQVEQITETEAFQQLQAEARRLRRERKRERAEQPGMFEHIQQKLDQRTDPADDVEEI